jgi:gamma-glutamyl phosphate reductase
MATEFLTTCINKREHLNAYERITHIGGTGWKHTETLAIANIEAKTHAYHLGIGSAKVMVIVASRNNRKYLKTANDGEDPNNLLALRECK